MTTVKTEYVQVEGHSSLLRDEHSTAIVSNDTNSYELYKKRRETFKIQKNEINTLKNEVGEIKELLHTLIEKVNG
tara:strand:+ start:401 stop:625 length:225 start_codon:yes stop_codon:yes gene_type:complete